MSSKKIIKHLLILVSVWLIYPPTINAQKTEIVYLSGKDKDQTIDWDFFCTQGRNSGKWAKIPVPSNWELHGFGNYNYGHDKDKGKEEGLYKYSFKSPENLSAKNVFIVFDGVMTDAEVKINGKVAGPVHQGSFYRFRYDIAKLLNSSGKENLLEVKVSKHSADSTVNDAERESDFWIFGGIYRPVFLEVLPSQFIERVAIDAKMDGSFNLDVFPSKIKDATSVEAQLKTLDGRLVGQLFSAKLKKQDAPVHLFTEAGEIKPWSPEFPNLYEVEITLKNSKGLLHQIKERFGFRTVDFREGIGFFVNGEKILFKGVNRHSFWPSSGRTTSKALSIVDVNLMKDMNMNAVRMSHYPPDKHFLEVCDSLGLFVLNELTGWQQKYGTEVGRKLVKELVTRDVNHPSVVIWDNGNEGGNNHDLVDEYAKYDPQKRIVIHPWNIFRGTDTGHYKGYGCCTQSLYNGNKVFFPTEFLHGLYDGGHGAGLNDHWNLMLTKPLSAGGFLWVFADEGIVRVDKENVIDTKGHLAPDGIVGPYREKEGSFYAIKEIWSPVFIEDKNLTRGFDGKLNIQNRYHFTNLDQITFEWELVTFDKQNASVGHGEKGSMKGPSLAPWRNGQLQLQLPADLKKWDALYLKAVDLYGREIFTWSWPLKTPKEQVDALKQEQIVSKPRVAETAEKVSVSANGIEIGFDKKTGMITGIIAEGKEFSLSGGAALSAGESKFESLKHYKEGDSYVVELVHQGDFRELKFFVLPSGVIKLGYSYMPKSSQQYPGGAFDYLGINFNYPESKVSSVKYLGEGPYRVWKNRMKGGKFGIWNKKYNNTITGESWDYPEFKGYYALFNWVEIETQEGHFKIYTETEDLFLRLFTPQKPTGARNDNTSPPFPSGDLSVMHAISPIGTKFDKAENHGPEGQKNVFAQPKTGAVPLSGVLYFDFRQTGE